MVNCALARAAERTTRIADFIMTVQCIQSSTQERVFVWLLSGCRRTSNECVVAVV